MTFALILMTALPSLCLLLLLSILRPTLSKESIWPFSSEVKAQSIILQAIVASILIVVLFLQASVNLLVAVKIALTVEAMLISLLVLRLVCAKLKILIFMARVKIKYIVTWVIICTILISFTLFLEVIGFLFAVVVTSVTINLIILQLFLSSRSPAPRASDASYLLQATIFGSIASFLLWASIIQVITRIDISSILKCLENSSRLQIWNSYPQSEGWGEEIVFVTDKEIIQNVSGALKQCKYKMCFQPGLFATRNGLRCSIQKDETQIGDFMIISTTFQTKTELYRYKVSNKKLLQDLRNIVGVNDDER